MALSVTPFPLMPTAFVSNVAAVLCTSFGVTGSIIKKGSFANVTGGSIALTLYRVALGGSVTSGTIITPGILIMAGDVYIANELINMVLNTGDAIWGVAGGANSITGTISGFNF